MKGTIEEIWEVVDEMVDEKIYTILEDEVERDEADRDQPADCLEEEGQKEIETGQDMDEGNHEDDIAWDPNRDSMDYWMQEFDNMVKDYKPVTKTMSEFKRKLGKPKTLLVAGGGVAALGLAMVGVVAGKKNRSRSVVHTLPVKSLPERKEEPLPSPAPPEQRTPPPVPWPFFYFR